MKPHKSYTEASLVAIKQLARDHGIDPAHEKILGAFAILMTLSAAVTGRSSGKSPDEYLVQNFRPERDEGLADGVEEGDLEANEAAFVKAVTEKVWSDGMNWVREVNKIVA